MTDHQTDMTAAEYLTGLEMVLTKENEALRKQLDEAREREAQMAAALRAMGEEWGRIAELLPADRRWPPAVMGIAAALSQEPPASHAPANETETQHDL